MTAALAYPTAPHEQSPPLTRTPNVGNGQFATFWEASSVRPAVEHSTDVNLHVEAPLADDDVGPAGNPVAEFARLLFTQWMALFVTYEALAATIDRRDRYLPTLGL